MCIRDSIYSKDADDFLNDLPTKIKDKIIYNIAKAKFVIDPELFKKLDDTDIDVYKRQVQGAGIRAYEREDTRGRGWHVCQYRELYRGGHLLAA